MLDYIDIAKYITHQLQSGFNDYTKYNPDLAVDIDDNEIIKNLKN